MSRQEPTAMAAARALMAERVNLVAELLPLAEQAAEQAAGLCRQSDEAVGDAILSADADAIGAARKAAEGNERARREADLYLAALRRRLRVVDDAMPVLFDELLAEHRANAIAARDSILAEYRKAALRAAEAAARLFAWAEAAGNHVSLYRFHADTGRAEYTPISLPGDIPTSRGDFRVPGIVQYDPIASARDLPTIDGNSFAAMTGSRAVLVELAGVASGLAREREREATARPMEGAHVG